MDFFSQSTTLNDIPLGDSFLERVIYGTVRLLNPIKIGYFNFLGSLGLSFEQILFSSFCLYCLIMCGICVARKWITGNYKTQLITEFSSKKPYRPKLSKSVKYGLILPWNIIMAFISLVLLITVVNTYCETGYAAGVNPFTFSGYKTIALTDWMSRSGGNLILSGRVMTDFVVTTKFVEWIDTIINLVCGNSVIMLHFWHHATIVASFSTGTYSSANLTIAIINALIHVVMYVYYALSVFRPLRPFLTSCKIFITVTQIVQFISGIWIGMIHLKPEYYEMGKAFYTRHGTSTLMYHYFTELCIISYLALFIVFFAKTYLGEKKNVNTKKGSGKSTDSPSGKKEIKSDIKKDKEA